MEKNNRKKLFHRLFIKLYINYAAMLMVFAVLIGIIFINLYRHQTYASTQKQLEERAWRISQQLTDYIIDEKYDDFLEYIYRYLQMIENNDVYTISNPYAKTPMNSKMETCSYDVVQSSMPTYLDMVDQAFDNVKSYHMSEDDYYGVPMVTVAVPVLGADRSIVGALLLKSQMQQQTNVITDSMSLIIISAAAALAISFVIVIVFAKGLSKPISRMRTTALTLADGNYNVKTGIKRKDEIGDLAGTIDILSERLLENDVERKKLDQMRLDFFANVSHELRTPITVIRAYAETLVDKVVTAPEKVNQYYERMLSECKSIERLVGDLLLLSKMQNPDFMIEKEPVNLNQVFEDIIRSSDALLAEKDMKIDLNKADIPHMIYGDYDRLRQMFFVIIDNAVKFSDVTSTIHILLQKEDKIIISIRDEGVGISEEDLSNIFEKFYKSNLKQNAKGSGLGLAIARQIALKHNGTIEVKSEVNVGTEFRFEFPILDEDKLTQE